MLKSNIDVFFVTSFLCSLEFLFFHRMGIDTVPVTLTFDL